MGGGVWEGLPFLGLAGGFAVLVAGFWGFVGLSLPAARGEGEGYGYVRGLVVVGE